ncbi:MAG TPA: hypothetical protein VGG83_20970 [Trebonia sp.]|jgi:hypothetical protein
MSDARSGRLSVEKNLLLVFTRPVEGHEDEFNEWYDQRHLPDVTGLPGIVAGQRFVFQEASRNSVSAAPEFGYLAIYEVPDGELDKAKAALTATSAERRAAASASDNHSVRVPGSPFIAPGNISYWFTAVGERVVSDAGTD